MTSTNTMTAAYRPFSKEEQWLTGQLKNITVSVHDKLSAGSEENIYEKCFCAELEKRNIPFDTQTDVQIIGNNRVLGLGRRIDISMNAVAVVVRGRGQYQPAWETQLRNYLKMTGKRIGYILNFPVSLIKNEITQRVYYSGKDNLLLITFSM